MGVKNKLILLYNYKQKLKIVLVLKNFFFLSFILNFIIF